MGKSWVRAIIPIIINTRPAEVAGLWDQQSSIRGGPSSIVKRPIIRCFVAKSGLSRFTRFLGVRFSAFDSNKYCQIGQ